MNEVILITGAGRGIGQALAFAFGKRKYKVGINFRFSSGAAEETAAQIQDMGGEFLLLPGDVSKSKDVQKIIQTVEEKWGRVDILVNNAGIARNALVSKMTEEEWDDVMAVNLKGAFLCSQAVIPLMRNQKDGLIWNMGSFISHRPGAGAANYAVAKAGLAALTKAIALEEGRFHIRANTILPGFHVTDLNKDIWPKIEQEIRNQHLVGTLPNLDDLGEFIFHLSQFKNLTGQEFAFEGRLL